MRLAMFIVFVLILGTMLTVTGYAGLHESLFKIPPQVTGDPWFVATLADAYCGFITFYVWVCYRERSVVARVIWFVLIMALGNIAMSSYVLLKLIRLPRDASLKTLLTG